ncbi:hypothetical protein BGZ47_009673 [Haplosporangium gracile]|nr:hypothetical protein BGZ47_009673 [Haplosporangium gracile]
MAVSPARNTLNVWSVEDVDTLAKYSVESQYWTSGEIYGSVSGQGVFVVTEPTAGFVYFPGRGSNYNEMKVYNPGTRLITAGSSSSPLVNARTYYTFGWSSLRNKLIYFTSDVGQ